MPSTPSGGNTSWDHREPPGRRGACCGAVPGTHQPADSDECQQEYQRQRQYRLELGGSRCRGGTSEAGQQPHHMPITALSALAVTSSPATPKPTPPKSEP